MRNSRPYPGLSAIGLALLLAASASQAEIYKWVDANGRTHYTQNKEEAERAKAAEVKIKTHTPSPEEVKASRDYWEEKQMHLKARQDQRDTEQRIRNAQNSQQPTAAAPRSLSNGRDDGSDTSKCNLARDILNGAVKLRNGGQIGDYERQTAENDISRFCH